ncbi:unnamed protein product [Polarella glacialis]|uniref:Secreted protein n=1 Tax=Polarella glacialis TaxID=89957 RepID=A0A813LPP2_POLGL|nr:unnamed protein product [Polarella glacialis]
MDKLYLRCQHYTARVVFLLMLGCACEYFKLGPDNDDFCCRVNYECVCLLSCCVTKANQQRNKLAQQESPCVGVLLSRFSRCVAQYKYKCNTKGPKHKTIAV